MAGGNIASQLITGYLQKVSLGYKNSAYVWDQIFPQVLMKTKDSKIPIWNRGDEFRLESIKRAPGTKTPSGTYQTTSVTPTTDQWATKHKLTKEELSDNEANLLSPPINLQQAVMKKNSNQLQMRIEKLVADLVTGGTWVDGNVGGEDAAAGWVATSSNTFKADIFTALDAIRKAGVPIDSKIRLFMDYTTFSGARQNGGITDTRKYAGEKEVRYPNAKEIADFFSIDACVVGPAIYSSAQKKDDGTDFTAVDMWGGTNAKGFGFLYIFPGESFNNNVNGDQIPAPGVSAFHKMENGEREASYKWYNKDYHTWFYEMQTQFGVLQTMPQAAYAWQDTHTT